VNSILERIKQAYHLETDAELADFLGINPSTLSMQRNRGRLNLQLIIEKCFDLNKNWLFHGKGSLWDINGEPREGAKIPIYESINLSKEDSLQLDKKNAIGWFSAKGVILDGLEMQRSSIDLMGYRISNQPEIPKLNQDDIAIINLANKNPEEGIFLTSRDSKVACRRLKKDTDHYGCVLGKLIWVVKKAE